MKVLAAVMQRLRAEPPAGPAKAVKTLAQHTTSHISVDHLKTPSTQTQSNMKTFTRSPLATPIALSAREIDTINAVFSAAEVQRAAGALHLKRQRLLEVAGFRSVIAEAIADVDEPLSVTPAQVVAVLDQMTRDVDEEICSAREDHAQHDARRRARLIELQPLRVAISWRLTKLTDERANCFNRIDALRRTASMSGAANHRYENLVAAGLTPEQINALGPSAQSPETQEAAIKDRVNAIEAELTLLKTFQANEHDVAPLAGLGFDALIDARNAAEQVHA